MKKIDLITYQINITCEIDEHGNIIPTSSNESICEFGKSENNLDMSSFPLTTDIMSIWVGKSKEYPKLKKEITII